MTEVHPEFFPDRGLWLADGASEITIETKAGGAFARSAERITIEARAAASVASAHRYTAPDGWIDGGATM